MFKKAVPVWIKTKDRMDKFNRHLVFRTQVENTEKAKLKIACADFYKLYINGEFAGHGPARAAKGYARVDEYDLSGYKSAEITVFVAGYNCCSLSTVYQDSFFAAEVEMGGEPVLYTGRDFSCFHDTRFIRKVERFSIQRHFEEHMDYFADDIFAPENLAETITVCENIKFIPRRAPKPFTGVTELSEYAAKGTFVGTDKAIPKANAYSINMRGEPDWGYFEEDEIEFKPYRYVWSLDLNAENGKGEMPVHLNEGEWMKVDFGRIESGFIRFDAKAEKDTQLVISFTEESMNQPYSMRLTNMQCVAEYLIPAGKEIKAETFEPYNFMEVAFFVKRGSIIIERTGVRALERDMSAAVKRTFNKPILNDVYRAAQRTFAHNAMDIFTDCPSRERAGWLCDSFFTGRAEYFLMGNTDVEDVFLENYVLYKNEGEFPEGVLPMVYPSDPHENNKFIPQWDMWYVMEVCEYLTKRRPDVDKEIFRPTVTGLINFFKKYENELGLLEKLPSWQFIEWSEANSWGQDVNYPTNMLYAAMLENTEKVFGIKGLCEKAGRIRKNVVDMAFNGEVFVDNAVRSVDGELENTTNVSEACQYYAALYCGIDINSPEFAKLKKHICNNFAEFVPEGKFCRINAFIGLYLRMNVLLDMKDSKLMLENINGFFKDMCGATDTLWEYRDAPGGSLDHGFASYVALTLPFADEAE